MEAFPKSCSGPTQNKTPNANNLIVNDVPRADYCAQLSTMRLVAPVGTPNTSEKQTYCNDVPDEINWFCLKSAWCCFVPVSGDTDLVPLLPKKKGRTKTSESKHASNPQLFHEAVARQRQTYSTKVELMKTDFIEQHDALKVSEEWYVRIHQVRLCFPR